MRVSRVVLSLVLVALALPAAAGVVVDWDSKATFAAYKTWAWKQGTPARSELAQSRLEKIVEGALAGEGLTPSEASPDLFVLTHCASEMRQELRVTDYGYAYGPGYYRWGYGYPSYDVDTVTYRVGTLVIDIVDAKTGKMVWRGEASDTIGDDPQKLEKKVSKVVAKMFLKYPPPAK